MTTYSITYVSEAHGSTCSASASFSLVLVDAGRLWFVLTCANSRVQISTKIVLFTTVIRNHVKANRIKQNLIQIEYKTKD